jgi:hypothetical protein
MNSNSNPLTTPSTAATMTPLSSNTISQLLASKSSTRIRSKDMFMLIALWMEKYPLSPPPLFQNRLGEARSTGCVLVDPKERIVGLNHTGESHSIVRVILQCPVDPRGFDMYFFSFVYFSESLFHGQD